ncbi:MAG TPA: DUF1152 domain-containing protein [Streptosporangiaceae bacterium]|nr:DUF1152 domain-containing protein [Streptosporangiaceae bacterium]
MGGTLLVAAGGGGDAITSAALASVLPLTSPPAVMTYSWDRLMIDPVPGPRSATDFTGLRRLAPHVLEVIPQTSVVPPAASSLPRLAAELPPRLLLLDPVGGAVQMAEQIQAAAALFGADAVGLVDVGGDILTNGADPGLRSPLADQLALAASVRAGLPARLLVTAPGIDGELPAALVLARLRDLVAEMTGISEIRYETHKARRLHGRNTHRPTRADLPTIDTKAREAASRGARYISMRRLAELLQATTLDAFHDLSDLLAAERPDQYTPSIYRTQPCPE